MNTDINKSREKTERARYNLAPASHRIFARILFVHEKGEP